MSDFYSQILIQRDGSQCWVWLGNRDGDGKGHGYGKFSYGGKKLKAHRFSWELFYGKIPHGHIVMHKCDNRLCVRPSHLRLGTHHDNMRDMTSKRRQARGARVATSKLEPWQVLCIRAAAKRGISAATLSRVHGVTHPAIRAVLTGRTWGHI